jgi:transposase
MAIDWSLYQQIRRLYRVEQKSYRAIARQLGVSRRTVRKYCAGETLPDLRKQQERMAPLREASEATIIRLLEENKTLSRKQRWSASRIWQHLVQQEGLAIAESTVRQYVRELRQTHPDIFIPLAHDPGEAMQVDWGDVPAVIGGLRLVVSLFCVAMPHSGAVMGYPYPDKTMLCFLDGHIRAFDLLGGVPKFCVYDNLRTAVISDYGKKAVKNPQFMRLEAHYAFQSVFCNIASGWEKSAVENAVSIIRRIAFTPMPHVADFAELQEHVTNKCLQYINNHQIRNHPAAIKEEFAADRAALLPLPAMPLDTGFTVPALVHPDLTVRYDNTRYSVPPELVGKQVTLKLAPFHLFVFHNGVEVYRHRRVAGKSDHQYVLEHYLKILSRKPRAVEQALPIRKGIMPDECREFLRLCTGKDARQQLVDILLLGREREQEQVLWALRQANNSRFPSLALVRTYLEMADTKPELDGPAILQMDLNLYDALLGEEGPGDVKHSDTN